MDVGPLFASHAIIKNIKHVRIFRLMHLNAAFRVNLVTYDPTAAMPCSTFIIIFLHFFYIEKKNVSVD